LPKRREGSERLKGGEGEGRRCWWMIGKEELGRYLLYSPTGTAKEGKRRGYVQA
jgi:hypothetical protein